MSDVVDRPAVSVSPRIRNLQRSNIVPKERSTEFASCFVLEGDSGRVLQEEQTQGVGDRALPSRRSRCKLAGSWLGATCEWFESCACVRVGTVKMTAHAIMAVASILSRTGCVRLLEGMLHDRCWSNSLACEGRLAGCRFSHP